MKTRLLLVAGLSMAGAGMAFAQTNAASCPAAGGAPTSEASARANAARDACLQAVDVFQLIAPQLGVSLTGGNATLGQGGTLGGIGHFAIGVRGNVVAGDLPEINKFPAPRTAANQSGQQLPSKDQIVGLPVVDAAIGLFKGVPLGLTNVGGVDLLVSATYVPTIGDSTSDVRIEPETNLKLGFGVRVGLLQESLVVPGISATYISRDVPTTTITGTSSSVDMRIRDASIKTTAWRVVASKSFLLFGVSAGFGQDTYDQSAIISGTAKDIPVTIGPITTRGNQNFGPVNLAQKMTRNNMFAGLSVNLPFIKLVGEVGQVSGGDVDVPTNTFTSGKADDSRLFGSVGLRFGW
jgi:hypothetical protein